MRTHGKRTFPDFQFHKLWLPFNIIILNVATNDSCGVEEDAYCLEEFSVMADIRLGQLHWFNEPDMFKRFCVQITT